MKTKIRAKKSWLQSHLLLVLGGSFIINIERFHGRGSRPQTYIQPHIKSPAADLIEANLQS